MIPPHPLTNFEIEAYHQNGPRFNRVYSRNNLPHKIKDGTYIISLDEYFGVEHITKEIKTFINNKNIIANTFRTQAYDSVMCGYFCIGFIDFMLKGKR